MYDYIYNCRTLQAILSMSKTCVFIGDELAKYGFPDGHPFSQQRHEAYYSALKSSGLINQCCIQPPTEASIDQLLLFHSQDYISKVQLFSEKGSGYLDGGDTPAFPGIFEAASVVVGTTLAGIDAVMQKNCNNAFNPIGGLHHAQRQMASGFCVFNDCGVAIEYLKSNYALQQILYVDIDAHHGDGVFYSYEDDEQLIFLDFHQDSRTLYPGSGKSTEMGKGNARGTKLNIEMPPGSTDEVFLNKWNHAKEFIEQYTPEFVLLQCGVDSMSGDPITDMHYSESTHQFVTLELMRYAKQKCKGRFVAFGGGGYNLENISKGWTAVTETMVNA